MLGALCDCVAQAVTWAESIHRLQPSWRTERILALSRALYKELKDLLDEGKARA
jgi:hypothetical protein